MRITGAGLAMLTTVLLAACGGSGSPTVTSASSSAGAAGSGSTVATTTVTHTATATTSAASSTAPSRPTTSGASVGAGASPCKAAGLALLFLGGQGATGHGELGFALRNTGSSGCSTVGYPGVQFLDHRGSALPTVPTHTTNDFFGHTVLRTLTVAPGQSVSFRLGVTHNPTPGQSCTTAYGLQVIAPNDTATLRVDLPDGAAECGVSTVSPMQSGDSAFP